MAAVLQINSYAPDRDIRQYPGIVQAINERFIIDFTQPPTRESAAFVYVDTMEQAQEVRSLIEKDVPAAHRPDMFPMFIGGGSAKDVLARRWSNYSGG